MRCLLLCIVFLPGLGAIDELDVTAWDLTSRLHMLVHVYEYQHQGFRLGDRAAEWDDSFRAELDFRASMPLKRRIDVELGGYLFWEDRLWQEGTASVDNQVLGLGWETSAVFYLRDYGSLRDFNVGLAPFARIGVGAQDALITGDFGDGEGSGVINHERWELALGLELRAFLAGHLEVALGAGVSYWHSDEGAITSTTTTGEEETTIPLRFSGDESWLRASMGIVF